MEKVTKSEMVGATLLVAGTCVGGGMLALPVATGVSGFAPSLVLMFICWLMMTATGLLYVEVSLWLEEGAHVITMARKMVGRWAQVVAWILYLYVSYASIAAYTNGAGLQIASLGGRLLDSPVDLPVACAGFLVVFTVAVLVGRHFLGAVNSLLFLGMIAAYVLLLTTGASEVDTTYLTRCRWKGFGLSVPLLLTAFSFQALAPSLPPYVKHNPKVLRGAVVGGTTTALLIYILWQGLVLGTVPAEGANSLQEALVRGEPATEFLRKSLHSPWMASLAEFFSFFAIVTSFLGMALGLFDFLADGLRIPEKGWGKIVLGLLVILPSFFFATYFHRVFVVAMDTSGGIGDSLLNGILPVLMVWGGRYRRQLGGVPLVPGGKVVLVIIALFFLGTLTVEILQLTGFLGEPLVESLD